MSDPKDESVDDEPTSGSAADDSPTDELKEAFGHLKNAASLLWGKATSDETVKQATAAAKDMAAKVGAVAEPAAKEVDKAFRKMGESAQPALAEAEKAVKKLGKSVEPLAKSAADQVGELGKKAAATIAGINDDGADKKSDEDEETDDEDE